jgi:hypothetical protein
VTITGRVKRFGVAADFDYSTRKGDGAGFCDLVYGTVKLVVELLVSRREPVFERVANLELDNEFHHVIISNQFMRSHLSDHSYAYFTD